MIIVFWLLAEALAVLLIVGTALALTLAGWRPDPAPVNAPAPAAQPSPAHPAVLLTA